MSEPTPAKVAEARETIRTCQAAGLYAGPIYQAASDVISRFQDARRAERRATAAEPSALVERLYVLAAALVDAERALDDFYGDELKLMKSDRAAQFEAIFPETPPYFEIAPIATAIKAMADGWQEALDAEMAAAEEADDRRRDNPLEPDRRRLGV